MNEYFDQLKRMQSMIRLNIINPIKWPPKNSTCTTWNSIIVVMRKRPFIAPYKLFKKICTIFGKEFKIFADLEKRLSKIEKTIRLFMFITEWLSKNEFRFTVVDNIKYPTIPTTKFAYQVYHKGEVNSFVEDYWDNNLFLISAKTSSGNSGSPIIDNSGMVVGVITEELFEKDKFYEKGKLPYYAGIPTVEIVKAITKYKNNCG